jgi:glycosyltransferase involved in cell wall biosynthesis
VSEPALVLDTGVAEQPAAVPRIVLVCSVTQSPTNGIRDYSHQLRRALAARGIECDLCARTRSHGWATISRREDTPGRDRASLVRRLLGYDWVIVQYNPFLYARWGFAPWLPLALLRLRLHSRRPRIALMVHEDHVDMTNWRTTLMGLWQRVQLHAIRVLSEVVLGSITAWTDDLREMWPCRATYHLPVGANVPDMRQARDDQRRALGIDSEDVVLAAFGTAHPSRLVGHIAASANALAATGRRVVLLNLGCEAPHPASLDARVVHIAPGLQSDVALAAHLAAADIFLAPFVDGVSTRRTTLMAALQHGLAVIGTDGALTDPQLRAHPDALWLVPVDRHDLFAQAVVRLATDTTEREARRRAARALFEGCYAWSVIAAAMASHLGLPPDRTGEGTCSCPAR